MLKKATRKTAPAGYNGEQKCPCGIWILKVDLRILWCPWFLNSTQALDSIGFDLPWRPQLNGF